MKRGLACALALLAALLPLCDVCAEEEAQGARILAGVGYDGVFPLGSWTPVEVEITASADMDALLGVQVIVEDDRYDVVETPVPLKAGKTQRVRLSVQPLLEQRRFPVTLTDADGRQIAAAVATPMRLLSSDAALIGVLGDPTGELSRALRVTAGRDALERGDVLETVALTAESFPQEERELAAFGMLVADGFDLYDLTEAQQALVLRWLKDGGILLAGEGERQSLDWLASHAGVSVPQTGEGALEAVRAYAGLTKAETAQETTAEKAPPEDALALDAASGASYLTGRAVGEGYALCAGFSLGAPQALSAAGDEALWQRVLLEAAPEVYTRMTRTYGRGNWRFSESLTGMLHVSEGVSILPAVLLLTAYVPMVGVALFALCKRRDRSRALWALIPLCAVACTALVAALGAALGLDRPTETSLTLAQYDADGLIGAEEHVSVAYPIGTRARLTAPNGARIERGTGGYFHDWETAASEDEMTLRDRVRVSGEAGIELAAVAPWYEQKLVVADVGAPQGAISATAWMEEDGLHARIANGTDAPLTDGVLLTELGYAQVGDLAPGETAEAFLALTEDAPLRENGRERILPEKLLHRARYISDVIDAIVNPEREAQDGFDASDLPRQEAYDRNVRAAELYAAAGDSTSFVDDRVDCLFAARCESLSLTPLQLDGETISRTAHRGVVTARATFERVGPTGVFYDPEGAHPLRRASIAEDGAPQMGEPLESDYYVAFEDEITLGFDLSTLGEDVPTLVRLLNLGSAQEDLNASLSIYDHEAGRFATTAQAWQLDLTGDALRRALGEEGQIFLRYSCPGETCDLSVPSIIVKGVAKTQKGGGAL